MVTLVCVEADDENCIRYCTDANDCIVPTWYWKFKSLRNLVNLPIRYTHGPYKNVNVGNVLLAGLCWEHDATAPRYATFLNSIILKWGFYLWHNYFRFIGSVMRFLTPTGLLVPVSTLKFKSKIGHWYPSLQNQPQYFMIKFVTLSRVCESSSGRKRRCFWRSFDVSLF